MRFIEGEQASRFFLWKAICSNVGIIQPVIDYAGKVQPVNPPSVRIGHLSGTLEPAMKVEEQDGAIILAKSALARTARLLMDGSVYVPDRVVAS